MWWKLQKVGPDDPEPQERGTCIKRLFWPPMRSKIKVALPKFLLNSQSVELWYLFDFYGCYGNKNGRQNRLKIGK